MKGKDFSASTHFKLVRISVSSVLNDDCAVGFGSGRSTYVRRLLPGGDQGVGRSSKPSLEYTSYEATVTRVLKSIFWGPTYWSFDSSKACTR